MNSWLAENLGFVLLQPEWLWLALALPAAWWLRSASAPPSLPFAPLRLLPERGLPTSLRQRLRRLPTILLALGVALLVLALARPAELVVQPRRALGVDLMLAIDRSSSMSAADQAAGRARIDLVKESAARFLAGRSGDRIGLLAFARYPDLLCAPTLRLAAVLESLSGLDTIAPDGPEDLTGIGVAAARAAEILRRAPGPARVLILLSDGEENVAGVHAPRAVGPEEAAELCRAWGVRVHAIAALPPAASMPAGLELLAARTGGTAHLAEDEEALDRIYRAIGELEASPLAEPELRVRERGGWCAAAAVLVALLGAGLRRRGWEAGP